MASEMRVISSSYKFIWKIENFSAINSETGVCSDVFSLGTSKWKIHINVNRERNMLSLFLLSDDLTKPPVSPDFSMAITSQTDRSKTVGCESKIRSPGEYEQGWAWPNFMSLSELYDPAKGYLVNDTCLITVQVSTGSPKVAAAPSQDGS